MGTWEEESRELIESRDGIANDFSSDGGHHDENDGGDDRVGVDVNVSGESEGDDLSYGVEVVDEADLVHKFERVKIRKNGSEGEERRDFEEAEDGDGDGEYHAYPLRPYAEDCSFYVKTGTCKFGPNCRYNHPANTGFQIEDTKRGIEDGGGSVADAGIIDCKYFNSTGGCKYGDACRYNHFGQRAEREYLELNSMGLPIRPSVQECTFFLRNGSCGYGANCRFNHPDSGSTKEYVSGNLLPNGSVRSGINMPRNYAAGGPLQSYGGGSQRTQEPSNGLNMRNGAPYPPDLSPYYQAMRQNPGWNPNPVMNAFPANKTPLPQPALNNFPKRVDPPTHYGNQMQMEEFPERPGQPDCDYFMKTGTCKFKSACRYNHPLSRASTLHQPPVSSKGLYSRPPTMLPSETSDYFDSNSNNLRKNRLSSAPIQQRQMQNGEFPERPGQPECEYYMKTGQCKFNSACKYHHPKTRVPTPSQCALSEKGLPLRPGAKLCRNYEQQGMCKYGPNCLFNHPDDYSQAIPATAQFHNATNVAVAANLEPPPAANNSVSAWDDGWRM